MYPLNDYLMEHLARAVMQERLREAEMDRLLDQIAARRQNWLHTRSRRMLFGLGCWLVALGTRLEEFGPSPVIPNMEPGCLQEASCGG